MVKLQIAAGKATPAPPVGTALGPQGINIMDFCKNFNARTAKDEGLIIPVVVTVYADRSYTFITKTPPAAVLLKRVTWPSQKEVYATTVVVILVSIFFGLYLFILDFGIDSLVIWIMRKFGAGALRWARLQPRTGTSSTPTRASRTR